MTSNLSDCAKEDVQPFGVGLYDINSKWMDARSHWCF